MPTTDVIVVKIGTTSVTTSSGDIDHAVLIDVARDIATLSDRGSRMVLVTSGAITAGWADVGRGQSRPNDSVVLQAVSAVGQPLLMNAWRDAFAPVQRTVGQVLLAPLDFSHRGQYLHARGTIHALWDLGVIPIVNENDAVADEEIRYGDNDRLAALVANLVAAQLLVLLTDTAGLHTADPRLDPTATLIQEVVAIDRELDAVAGSSRSGVGSGGMASKLAAARIATWSGVETVIAPARAHEPVLSVTDRSGERGTRFLARNERLPARKVWIAFATASKGRLIINQGAAHALLVDGRSLLRVGVVSREGDFDEGDSVEIIDGDGALVAKGLVRLSSSHWDDTEDVAVHRNDLVVVQTL